MYHCHIYWLAALMHSILTGTPIQCVPPLTCSLAWANLPPIPPLRIAPQNNLNIQSLLGHFQNSGGKKLKQTEDCILSGRTFCRSSRERESGLLRGLIQLQETFDMKNPAPGPGPSCFLSLFSPQKHQYLNVCHPSLTRQVVPIQPAEKFL